MSKFLRQSTASQEVILGYFVDSTDGNTEETGLTIANTDIKLHKAGATTLANKNSGGATHISNGLYYAVLDATDTDTLGNLVINCHPTGALAFRDSYVVLPAVVYDAIVAGTDNLDVSVTQWTGTAVATPDTAGYPKVTVKSGAGTGEISLSSGGVALSTSGVAAVADGVWDEAASGHVAAGSFGARLAIIRSATAQAGAATTITLDASASAVDDFYNNQAVFIVSGTGVGQGRIISDYVGSTKVATVSTWATNPSSDSVFVIVPFGSIPGATAPTAGEVADAVWDELLAGHTTEASYGALMQSRQLHAGTAQAGGASSITFDATGSSATDDLYNYQFVTIRSGTGAGQTRQIADYNGTTKVATVNLAWTTNPSTDSEYVVHPGGLDAATVASIADAVWDEARSGHVAAGSFGEYVLADATRISGDATAADNAESFFDGTGYAGTNNVIPTVTTVDTVTTLTGHTPQTGDAYARLGAPAGASVSADVAAVKADTAAILTDTGTTLDGKIDTIDTVVDAIKAKTDSLTFTQAGHVDANVQRINDVVVNGDGSTTPWGP